MYVIFPADEVVYLSYGRLIVVPPNSNPETTPTPIRANSLSYDYCNALVTGQAISKKNKRKQSCVAPPFNQPLAGPSRIDPYSVQNHPSTSQGAPNPPPESEKKSKKKSLKFNFSLLKRNSSRNSENSSSNTRVRKSVGHIEQARAATPPSEAFRKFCYISSPEEGCSGVPPPSDPKNKAPNLKEKEKTPSVQGYYNQDKFSSKRSSSSSKNSKSQEDQTSKRSSKHSSSSSKSKDKVEKGKLTPSPVSICNDLGAIKRSSSQIQRETRKDPGYRKVSTPTNLTTDTFYPLSTSREKNLVEPSPEALPKKRSSSFRITLRRSKSPDVSSSQPLRPDRKRDKKPKGKSVLERKLSFSDFVALSRVEKSSELRPEGRGFSESEKLPIKKEKSPVLSFFRKTPSPKNLGRSRTPNTLQQNRDLDTGTNQTYLDERNRAGESSYYRPIADRRLEVNKPKGLVLRRDRY
ncbi:hypothetical protein GWI33_016373 [Rhynchophorus ferrugineus]|uniref:Uncharacterized protein n=1 Tax=Rhynchophorus ferrugineus TaxID=354439 RepID=A0A834HY48_RHYFE|nr:hypothetical protein GWI33_016373 [Rhynchophorus ferrugineus]